MPDGYPTPAERAEHGWTPVPRVRRPFPSILAAGDDDPLGAPERVAEPAHSRGSRLVHLGAVGHLNPASGYGEWPRAEERGAPASWCRRTSSVGRQSGCCAVTADVVRVSSRAARSG
ncbi:alpha/beta hydrolase [Streptomyces collinus]|uniref:RBBP9/YdeN family alpha/beta hydrolase n=1 Tax=Streptomyces collinus TaxID=42684 RepID=UPI0036F0CD9E